MEWLLDLDPEFFSQFLSDALSAQVTQFSMAFGLAAWIHSGRVKKEIATQLSGIKTSLDHFAETLDKRISIVEVRLAKIEEKDQQKGVN